MGSRAFPPTISLSTRVAPLLPLSRVYRVARDSRVDGVDLDVARRPTPIRPHEIAAQAEAHGVPIRSVWVPRGGRWRRSRRESATSVAIEVAGLAQAETVVVRLPDFRDGRASRAAITGITEPLRALVRPTTRIATAIDAAQLEGGRRHLVQLTALRRLAEEWDFDIALDLLGSVDPQWEVEAAITRLGGRLTLLRLGPVGVPRSASIQARLTARALASALDGGFGGCIALAPSVPVWQRARPIAVTRACASAAEHVRLRYATVLEQTILDRFPDPRPKHLG
jgi:hypothetical protein